MGLRDLRDRIVDTSIAAAEEVGWENLRLRTVAQQLHVPLTTVLEDFRDMDAVTDAWFTRALAQMLRPPEAGFEALSAGERAHTVLMRWFDAQAAHRRVVGEMLGTKLYPSHPHHWVPMIFSLSRLIQWVREAALLDAGGRRRQMEEVGLTWVFLQTLRVWLRDGTPGQAHTRRFLGGRLGWLNRRGRSDGRTSSAIRTRGLRESNNGKTARRGPAARGEPKPFRVNGVTPVSRRGL
jgi:AcrR family transcriptional regulator